MRSGNISISAYLKMLRPLDWVKNVIMFAPLFFTPSQFGFSSLLFVCWGFVLFCIIASSIYILNDIKDFSADQQHPVKSKRAIASGQVSLPAAKFSFVVLSILGLLLALLSDYHFFCALLTYYVLNLAYCLYLKNISIIDVYAISLSFIIRVYAGATLIAVSPSGWLLACAGLLALFLALAKRRDDLVQKMTESHRKSISGYNLSFIDTSINMVVSALFIAYMVYATLDTTAQRLGTVHFVFTVPLVLLGILRYLQVTLVECRSGSPTELIYKDRMLQAIVIAWVLLSISLVYF